MLKAVIFDFDGLILDTELPEYLAWKEIFQRFGCSFPKKLWIDWIGNTTDVDYLIDLIEKQSGRKVDPEVVQSEHLDRFQKMVEAQPVLPGVTKTLVEAHRLGLKLGLASSSSRAWVEGHLGRLGLLPYFEAIRTRDDVRTVKPDPELYLKVLKDLGVKPGEAIALEDSPNGLAAARAAGVFCIIVPSHLTEAEVFEGAGMRLRSLEELELGAIALGGARHVPDGD